MAKQKIKKSCQLEINGILDTNENGEYIVVVEEEEFLLKDLLSDMCGTELILKCVAEI